jgi:hypothetical protein
MSKNKIFFLVIILVIIIGGSLTGYFLFSNKKISNNSKEASLTNLFQKEEITADLTYKDSSGFSFQYPASIKVTDVTPNNELFYTSLKLSKGDDNLTINIQDTSFKTADDWFLSEDSTSDLKFSKTIDLGGISAKQYSSNSKIITVAVDKGVLYLIEGINDKGYWEKTQEIITSTFSFAGIKTGGGSDSSDGTIYEEEEVIE